MLSNARSLLLIRQSHITHSLYFTCSLFSIILFCSRVCACLCMYVLLLACASVAFLYDTTLILFLFFLNSIKLQVFHENVSSLYNHIAHGWKTSPHTKIRWSFSKFVCWMLLFFFFLVWILVLFDVYQLFLASYVIVF